MRKVLWRLCLLSQVVAPAMAGEGLSAVDMEFTISDVQVRGLERIEPGTVFNYLPFQVGDQFTSENSAPAIRALYQTGFFEDVRLEREGDTLVVLVVERPAIGSVEISGNKDIKTEDLLDALRELGFVEGRVYNKSQLERIENELAREYFALGKYAARVTSKVTELDDNRVAIKIDIFEGKKAKINSINIIGAQVFDEDDLLDKFNSSTSGWLSFISGDDQYSRQKLAADLELLQSFYQDHGYVRFAIDSTQVSISPDRQNIYIAINISEGGQYRIADILLAGQFIVPEEDLFELITIARGDLFSRKAITAAGSRITERLGEEGYAFANVNPVPKIDDENNSVELSFFIDPGKRSYVRRVTFSGNERTRDEVLRREMRQQESSWFSTTKVERSRVRLQRLGYFSAVNVETPQVPGTDDQVDVNYSVTEGPAGSLLAGIGFSQNQGLIFRFSVTQDNFIGTGNRVNFTFNNSQVDRNFSVGYVNPYYTIDGVSRGFNASYRRVDAGDANVSDYDATVLSTGVDFGFPISEYNFFNVGLAHEINNLDTSPSGQRARDFIAREGNSFNQLRLTSSFSYDTRNKALLPNRGVLQRFGAELGLPSFGRSLSFFKIDYRTDWYLSITESLTMLLEGDIGYGDGFAGTTTLPFYENFYLGGPRSIRGFEENTVGPKDSSGGARGGNLKLFGSAELILPLPFIKESDQLRVTSFFDIGNVYDLDDSNAGEDSKALRYSVGLSGIWVSPVGLLTVSLASPLGSRPGDRTQGFQFTFGTSF